MILTHRVEDIRHRCRAALDGEHVELAHERMLADHFLAQVLRDDDLGELQHPIRYGIVRGKNAFTHFVEKIRSRQTQLVAHIRHAAGEKVDAGRALVLAHEQLETLGKPFALWKTAHTLGHIRK
jgi:membrane-bound lytic murein transglycosylase MltF